MKNLVTVFIFFFFLLGKSQENNFIIVGKTNVNTFKCIDKNFSIPSSFANQESNKIILNINDFDCKHDYITKDFRKTLNAEKFPHIQISFGKLRKNPNGNYSSNTEVRLMNKTKNYNLEFTENGKYLTGRQQVKFSDFGIIPPKKMGGMIVVKDELDLSFQLSK